MNSFGWIDWGIIGVYLIGTMVAGLAMRRYVGKVEHFIVAGREMDVYLGIASLAATEFGIITAMYTAELGFKNGFAGATPGILMAVAMAVVGFTGFVITPLRESGVLTIPELLDRKFGMRVRWLSPRRGEGLRSLHLEFLHFRCRRDARRDARTTTGKQRQPVLWCRLLACLHRSDSGRVAKGWVCSRIYNPPQGLTALAPPERGIV